MSSGQGDVAHGKTEAVGSWFKVALGPKSGELRNHWNSAAGHCFPGGNGNTFTLSSVKEYIQRVKELMIGISVTQPSQKLNLRSFNLGKRQF